MASVLPPVSRARESPLRVENRVTSLRKDVLGEWRKVRVLKISGFMPPAVVALSSDSAFQTFFAQCKRMVRKLSLNLKKNALYFAIASLCTGQFSSPAVDFPIA